MIRAIYSSIFLTAILVLKPSMELLITYNIIWPLFGFILLLIFNIKINRHRFTLTNIDSKMIVPILTGILKEKNISYEKYDKKIVLKDFDNKEITYSQVLNSVDIDFNNIKSISFYKEIEEELKYSVKKIELKVFPSSGLFYVALGITHIILIHNLYI